MTDTPIQADLVSLREAMRYDNRLFIAFMLGEELSLPVPDFHVEGLNLMCNMNIQHLLDLLPRDHAKTTLAKLAICKLFWYEDFRFGAYISNTHPVAAAACLDIVNFLSGPNQESVFGKVEFITKRDAEGFFKFKLWKYPKNGAEQIHTIMLKAQGAGMQVRGLNIENQRPDLMVIDDLEDRENINTKEQLQKLRVWTFGTLFKAMNKLRNKKLWLANLIASRSITAGLLTDPDWFVVRKGCIVKGPDGKPTPLWPDKFPMDWIRKDYLAYKRHKLLHVWFAEMMNQPIVDGLGLIASEDIEYAPPIVDPQQIQYAFITIDPAISKKREANRAAIAVHGWAYTHWQICEVIAEQGLDPISLFRVVVSLCIKWRTGVVGIESDGFQASLQFVFQHLAYEYPHIRFLFVPVYSQQRTKTSRLKSWCAFIADASYKLPDDDIEITQQLLTYDPNKEDNDDDVIDTCAYGVQMQELYLSEIAESRKTFFFLQSTKQPGALQIATI